MLQNVIQSMHMPDIIVFGLQEVIDLESRKMATKTVIRIRARTDRSARR